MPLQHTGPLEEQPPRQAAWQGLPVFRGRVEGKRASACLPDVQLLIKHEVVVEVGDGSIHSIAVHHLHHGCPRLAFHELHLSEERETPPLTHKIQHQNTTNSHSPGTPSTAFNTQHRRNGVQDCIRACPAPVFLIGELSSQEPPSFLPGFVIPLLSKSQQAHSQLTFSTFPYRQKTLKTLSQFILDWSKPYTIRTGLSAWGPYSGGGGGGGGCPYWGP